MKLLFRARLKSLFQLLLILFFLSVLILYNVWFTVEEKKDINCYKIKNASTLPSISDITPRKGKSIFFHETSCNSFKKGKIVINARQACAVESTAKFNPNFDVFLLYSSPGVIKFEGDESDRFLNGLLSYKNVKIMYLDYEKYTKDTPVEILYTSGAIDNSSYVIEHASDIVRYVTLWKYGGIYMDLDVLLLKSLENIQPNFSGIESTDVIGAGVMGFEPTGSGHKIVESCLEDLRVTFDGNIWSSSGPGVITRVLSNLCSTNSTEEMIKNRCGDFSLLPEKYFYPVSWQKWKMYFKEKDIKSVVNLTKDSYAIHVWNRLSSRTRIPLTSNVPYLHFAKNSCPKVVEACDYEF